MGKIKDLVTKIGLRVAIASVTTALVQNDYRRFLGHPTVGLFVCHILGVYEIIRHLLSLISLCFGNFKPFEIEETLSNCAISQFFEVS